MNVLVILNEVSLLYSPLFNITRDIPEDDSAALAASESAPQGFSSVHPDVAVPEGEA